MLKLLLQEGNLSKAGRVGTPHTAAEIIVRLCSQLLPEDLGWRQAAINPAAGPGHFDMSEFPASLRAAARGKRGAAAKPQQSVIDAIINAIRATYFVLYADLPQKRTSVPGHTARLWSR